MEIVKVSSTSDKMKEEIKIKMKIKISSSWKDLEIEDEIGLISQIYGGYPDKISTINIALIDSEHAKTFIESQESYCGITKLSTLHKFIRFGAFTITEENKIDFHNPSWCLHDYTVSVDWEKLHLLAGFYHDTEARKPFGSIQQEKIIRKIILKKAINKKSNKFFLSEWDLGSFIAEPIDDEHYSYDESPDLHIKFMTTLFQLERDKFITIVGIDFDFDNARKFLKNVSSNYDEENFIYDDYYLPAAHCHVEIEINPTELEMFTNKEKPVEENNEEIIKHKNWSLKKDIKEAHLIHKHKIKFTFKHNDSIEYRCFEYLFNHINKKVPYEEIYKYAFRLKYPAKGNRTKANKAVMNVVRRIVKKLQKMGINDFDYSTSIGSILLLKK